MNLAVGTLFAKNYLAFARVLGESLRRFHPDVPFIAVLTDEVEGRFDPACERFSVVPLAQLDIPDVSRFLFRYSRKDVAVAAKPHLLRYLLDLGYEGALFLDVDVLLLEEIGELFERVRRHAITLVPHLLAPLEGRDRVERELAILKSGVFNGGIVGVGTSPAARRFLAWWGDRLQTHCRHSLAEGLYYDQRWLDLVPGFFEDVHVSRDPGVDVAHWNLPERLDSGEWRTFHFSGFDPDAPDTMTRYADRFSVPDVGDAAALFASYRDRLWHAGWPTTRSWASAYDRFDNGVPIPDVARELYTDLGDQVERFGDPFETSRSDSYFGWLKTPVEPGSAVTRLWHGVYRRRIDLQLAFPDPLGADREAFADWTVSAGVAEHRIPSKLVGRN